MLTKPYSPATIGKVKRWHQTLQTDFLNDAGPFETIEQAQAAVEPVAEPGPVASSEEGISPPVRPTQDSAARRGEGQVIRTLASEKFVCYSLLLWQESAVAEGVAISEI